MLEAIGRLGRGAAAVHQLGGDQLVERGLELRLGPVGDRGEQGVENSRPSAAPIWAISLTGARRSRRASSESWSVAGIASGGSGPDSS